MEGRDAEVNFFTCIDYFLMNRRMLMLLKMTSVYKPILPAMSSMICLCLSIPLYYPHYYE